MSSALRPSANPHRERVVVFLAVLSSERCRTALAPPQAPEAFAFDLCRLWFESIYTPGRRLVDGLRAAYSHEETRRFEAAFSDDERAALERFHHFLGLRIDMLPDADRRAGRFPSNERWDSLVRHAGYLLETLEPDPARVEAVLNGLIQQGHPELDSGSPQE